MCDPLKLLRDYNINKKGIIEQDGQVIFGEYSFPKSVKTNFHVWSSGRHGTPNDYYTLECLLYILKNESLVHPVYARKAAVENVQVVRRPDRKDLLAYLNGEISTCCAIHSTRLLEVPTQVKPCVDYDEMESLAKKPRLTDTAGKLDTTKKPSFAND